MGCRPSRGAGRTWAGSPWAEAQGFESAVGSSSVSVLKVRILPVVFSTGSALSTCAPGTASCP